MTRIIVKTTKLMQICHGHEIANILLCFYIEIKPLELLTNRVSKERVTQNGNVKSGIN